MANFKSSYSRLARIFEKSRNQWKDKATERGQRIRALEVKVRDLEKSRALWKNRALDLESSEQPPDPAESPKETTTHDVTKVDDERLTPYNHQFSLLMIRLSIELQLAHISLRGTCRVLELFDWALLEKRPTYPTVQNWTCRYALYLLNQQPEHRTDWVFVVDHTVGLGKKKCLIILGISEEKLEQVGYCPSHRDMQVLRLEVTELGTGEAVSASLEEISKKTGVPSQVVADHGSDVCKGIKLYQERHPETVYTYDISHRMAIFLKQELSSDPRWNSFHSQCGPTIPLFHQTNLAFLCPPKQRTKARYMQVHHQIAWGQNMLRYYDRGNFLRIETGFALNNQMWGDLCQQFSIEAGLVLLQLINVKHPDLASLRMALAEQIGEQRVNSIPDQLWEQADVGKQRFIKGFEWLLEFRQELEIYDQILDWSHSVQKQLKTEGLSQQSRQTIKQSFDALCCQEPRLQRLAQKTLDYLLEETEAFPDGKVALASSDIIESVIGSYKVYAEKGPLKEIGKLVLMIPVLVSGVCKEKLREVMETVPARQVKEWLDVNCGPSMMAERREAFSSRGDTVTV